MRKKLTDWLSRFDDEIHVAAFAFVIAANAASAAAASADGEIGASVLSSCITVAAIVFHAWIVGQRMELKWESGRLAGHVELRKLHEMRRRHEAEAESTSTVTTAIDAAARRAVASGQHAKVQAVIDSWRERQDAQLVEVLRELEQLTRPVGEA